METTTYDRLREVRIYYGLTQKEMADLLKVQRTYYSEIEGGKRPISAKIIMALVEIKPISLDWLQTGVGEMLVNAQSLRELQEKVQRFKHDLKNTNDQLSNVYFDLDSIKYLITSLIEFLNDIELYSPVELLTLKDGLPKNSPLSLEYNEFYDSMLKRLEIFAEKDKAIEDFVQQLTNFLAIMKPLDSKNILPNFNPKFWPKELK